MGNLSNGVWPAPNGFVGAGVSVTAAVVGSASQPNSSEMPVLRAA